LAVLFMPRIATIIATLTFACVAAAQAPPATAPSTQASAELPADSPIRGWFADLASPDATVRDRAQTQLMGISHDDLGGLRTLIEHARPLAPAQVAALHDIVIQVFLAAETYDPVGEQSFLGVQLDPDGFGPNVSRMGVPIQQRFPGFPAYQMLRDGDMILAVIKDPNAPVQQLPNLQTFTSQLLHEAVATTPTSRPIELLVLRQGQQVHVTVRLAPLPRELTVARDVGGMNTFLSPRLQRAEQYWQEQFVPLVRADVS
jgi:hypothetical protein